MEGCGLWEAVGYERLWAMRGCGLWEVVGCCSFLWLYRKHFVLQGDIGR